VVQRAHERHGGTTGHVDNALRTHILGAAKLETVSPTVPTTALVRRKRR
jgi:hypothetical protein